MQTTLDYNTTALSEFHFKQDQAEKDWELSKPEKCDEVVAYAHKIMSTVDRTVNEFTWTFNEFLNEEDPSIWNDEDLEEALDNWLLGNPPDTVLEAECLWSIGLVALEAASHILYDVELEELSTWSTGEINTRRMVRELLALGNLNGY